MSGNKCGSPNFLYSGKGYAADQHTAMSCCFQVYVDQMDFDIVAVTRHNPKTHEGVVLVAFTAFTHPSIDAANCQKKIRPLQVEGLLDEVILEATLNHVNIK